MLRPPKARWAASECARRAISSVGQGRGPAAQDHVARKAVVLSNGVIGAEKQAIALAEAVGLPFTVLDACKASDTGMPAAFRGLPTWVQLLIRRPDAATCLDIAEPVPPMLAISCGRGSIPASIALRAATGGRTLTVHVQRPDCDDGLFDLVVAPRHDYPPCAASRGPNVLVTDGSLHRVTPCSLRGAREAWKGELEMWPAPRLAMLVGGTVCRRVWQRPLAPDLTPDIARELVDSALRATREAGGSLLVASSRRTPELVRVAIDETLQVSGSGGDSASSQYRPPPIHYGPDSDPNPYLGLLACADYILATADSINMVSEACGAAKPVYVARPRECARRFLAFHERMLTTGRTREWQGTLEPQSAWAVAAANGNGGAEPQQLFSDVELAAVRIRDILGRRGHLQNP
jgi:mitochondrial fission protein ELM1